jgi:hypothetical protein
MRTPFASRMHEWFGLSESRRDLDAAGLADYAGMDMCRTLDSWPPLRAPTVDREMVWVRARSALILPKFRRVVEFAGIRPARSTQATS